MAEETILVIEDNPVERDGLAALLRAEGYAVVALPDGQQALDYLRANDPPNLILLDMLVQPPGLDGWHFLDLRQRLPGLAAAMPVVVVTGLRIANREWALSLGACGLVRKPVQSSLLLKEVRTCLESCSIRVRRPAGLPGEGEPC